ncbi:aldehyde dehydrogenase (NADP(+)) [Novosphingobium sp. ERN07]|uniref:aldehyde dehydrogenase (NADP(+)) n=1 Tax=Novosphingobium sp. ERN07 TaxID=2726187 RepID=UPI00145711DD|nr:aldehyde dehydrogenase (NADP(+)) [Novosphingobium sp. ERN07]NLR71167.1 aldehyde dehydrogenase (NADP(+)) [Novosphingobium sp. ERN07]
MAAADAPLFSIDAATGKRLGDPLPVDGPAEVAAACAAADAAFDPFRMADHEVRARLLERIGDELVATGDVLIETAMRESGLPRARLEGERGRTVGQLRLFADVVRKGDWLERRIDLAMPDRQPLPRPDLRMRMIPLGPVAVFGASNFPLAFSTAGGDTASALAAGCPVVVKAHPAHPRTALLAAEAIGRAVAALGLPAGVFGQVQGPSAELGTALVRDPRIAAVGFTGSRGGGLALGRIAQERPVPIPVYAEMSSINPVVLLPQALQARAAAIGQGFAQSLTMGAGQFCTNPGLVLGIAGEELDAFCAAAGAAISDASAQVMLTDGIRDAYARHTTALARAEGVTVAATGALAGDERRASSMMLRTNAATFLANPRLHEEVFGPAGLVVACADADELAAVLRSLEGQLTATLHMAAEDLTAAQALLPILERKVGRILVNGWPTGVEVCDAMVHGGPFPATTDARTTSVGSLAIDRFLRPVCYQNFPQGLLPDDLAG